MTASKTVLPVLGVPVESKALKGLDSLLSIAQMRRNSGGTLAIGKAGAINAALLARRCWARNTRRFGSAEEVSGEADKKFGTPDPAKALTAFARKKK